MLLARPNTLTHARLGLAISKRHVKLACRRNTIKRIVRRGFSLEPTLPCMDIVILSRHSTIAENKESLWREITSLWARLIARSHG